MSKKSSVKKVTPAMEQWHREKENHPGMILFFRMGDFYEMFYDDAKLCSDLLGLTLTSRDKGGTPMAGIPHHQCERYVKDLIDLGQKVAICDQLEDPAQAKGVVRRGVTRVVTPGTVLEENCLSSRANNFLASVMHEKNRASLSCLDLSTGEFFVSVVDLDSLGDELERLAPAETLVPSGSMERDHELEQALRFRSVGVITERDAYHFDSDQCSRMLMAHFNVRTLDGFGITGEGYAIGAAGAVLQYVSETQMSSLTHIRSLKRVERSDSLILDRTTQRNLELTHPLMQEGKGGTLLRVLDRTRTGPGGRLLRNWLLSPLSTLAPILERQEAVRELCFDHMLRAELRELLGGISDMERIMARVITARANARDLVMLANSIAMLPGISALGGNLSAGLLQSLAAKIDPLEDLENLIRNALVDEPPVGVKEGRMICSGYHAELDELRDISRGGKDWIARFQESERERTGISSLKVGFNKVFGYYIEITKTHKDKAPAEYDRKQTLVNAERYITPELKNYESKVLGAEERIVQLEYELFVALRDEIAKEVARVQDVARALASLDCLAALAEVTSLNRYVIPEVHEGIDTSIVGGRHPVLETLLQEGEFVANDTVFNFDNSRMHIITGPNMAGKSTYIRQVALIAIMAHMGCGVPADSCSMGLIDRIFTRVGAADDLARGQSTFMVEMSETANILNNATGRSLVILDEVGRGTSTFDGVSLAWAITEYLHNAVKCRTLFATHYHELAELGLILDGADNLNVAVRDWGGEIIFLHKIQPGSCDRSYGIQVGRLAGIPMPVVERAREILDGLENQAVERDMRYTGNNEVLRAAARDVQLDLFASQQPDNSFIVEELSSIDPDRLSPIEAHQRLVSLIAKISR